MALDRLGNTIATGQVLLLAGTVRYIDGDDVVIGLGNRGEHSMRVKAGDVVTVDAATAGGGGGGVSDGDKGDIVVSSGGTVWTLDPIGTGKLGGDITAAGKALLDDATVGAQRTTLGLGPLATASAVLAASQLNYGGVADRIAGSDGSGAPALLRSSDIIALLGLGDLAFVADIDASQLVSGILAAARLGSGTADGTTFLRGDGTWAVPAGGGGGIEFHVAKRLAYLRL